MRENTIDLKQIQEGSVILINKPLDWTSFDVVNKLRYALTRKLGIKKLKVGHAGTLDPKATGLLIICAGKFTKRITEFQDMDKTYTGTFFLGATRPSFDMETEINEQFSTDHITLGMIDDARKTFIGDIMQMPPVYSAIKQEGKAVYKKAHKGEGDTVTMEARAVRISSFEITRTALPEIDFEIVCSKGTYVRSLAYDFGKALESGAYLQSLHRVAIGDFRSKDAWPLDELIKEIHSLEAPVVKVNF